MLIDQFIVLKESEGLYGSFGHSASASPISDGRRAVRWGFRLPSRVSPGSYDVSLFTVRDGSDVVEKSTSHLQIVTGGLPALFSSLAYGEPLVYGVICVVIAILTGFLMGFLFKRKDGH